MVVQQETQPQDSTLKRQVLAVPQTLTETHQEAVMEQLVEAVEEHSITVVDMLLQQVVIATMDLTEEHQQAVMAKQVVVEQAIQVMVQPLMAEQVEVEAVEQDKTMLAEQAEQDLSKSSIKMYAIVYNNTVIGPLVATLEELEKVQKENPDHNFIEMTEENSPAVIGNKWTE